MRKNRPTNPDCHARWAPLALALFALAPLRAFEVSEWKNRQTLRVDTPGTVTFALPPETLDAARADHGDLRLLDPAGREVAFGLSRMTPPAVRPTPAKAFRSTLTATATEVVIDTGDTRGTSLVLASPAPNFLKAARIETSADGVTWRLAGDGVPLFRQFGAEQLAVPAAAAFVRITLDDSRSRPVPITGAMVVSRTASPPVAVPLGVRIARREEFAGETVLALELDAAHTPLDKLEFSTPERLYTRRVTIGVRELGEGTAVERTLTTGTIFRVAFEGDAPVSQSTVRLGFVPPTRELIVHIVNGDSPPLAFPAVALTRHEVRCYFDAAVVGDYTLLTGNERVTAPRYDVAGFRPGPDVSVSALTPGPLTPNPGYRAPETLPGTTLLGAAIDPAPWRFRKAVQVTTPGVQQLELDLDVQVRAQAGFGDVRLVRDGAQVPYLLERPALSRSLDLTLKPANDPSRPRLSRWEIALPQAGLPLTRLTLSSPTPLFQRHLRVFETVTDDRGNRHERTFATGEWSHTPGEARPVTLPLNSTPATATLIVETDNGDNPPIALTTATATHGVVRLLFKTEAAPVALYYGNAQATSPRYDLALVAGQILTAPKIAATLGPEENARPEGWAKHALAGASGGALFWAVLALVVMGLLGVVAKLLPKPPAAST
ncbi:MAG: hypothetical protein ABIQ12_14630 [Opitutaceae bacterium]